MTLSPRVGIGVFVVGLLLGAVGPTWGWWDTRAALSTCEDGLTAREELARKERTALEATRDKLGQELARSRAGAFALRALADMDGENYGLARERLAAASQALETSGQDQAAARLRGIVVEPGTSAAARAEIIRTAEVLISDGD